MKRILLLLLALTTLSASAENQAAKVHALFVFQFAKYTGWPKEDAGKPFVISVVGDNEVAEELRKATEGKSIGGRSVDVVSIKTINDMPTSDIIYLGESVSNMVNRVARSQADRHVLIIGGTQGLCTYGASVAFVWGDNKVTFEICERNMARHGLHVSPKLASMGRQVP